MTGNYSHRGLSQIGAIELKRAYQKHLFQAEMSIVLLACAIVASMTLTRHLLPQEDPGEKIHSVVTDSVIHFIRPVDVEPPKGNPIVVEIPKSLVNVIPEPAPDTEVVDTPRQAKVSGGFGIGEDTSHAGVLTADPGTFVGTFEPKPASSDTFVYVDEDPVALKLPNPKYPELARRAGIEGVVSVRAHIGVDGNVIEAKIYLSSGTEIGFEEAALEAAKLALWRPAMLNKRPVAVWVSYQVRFKLK
jgi:TonB family protein